MPAPRERRPAFPVPSCRITAGCNTVITSWAVNTLPGGGRNLAITIPLRHGKTLVAHDTVEWLSAWFQRVVGSTRRQCGFGRFPDHVHPGCVGVRLVPPHVPRHAGKGEPSEFRDHHSWQRAVRRGHDRDHRNQCMPMPIPYTLQAPVPAPLAIEFYAEMKIGLFHVQQAGSIAYYDGI